MEYILAIDQGTTSSRAVLIDAKGKVAALAQKEFPQIFPQSGWVEHDPEAIWESQLACIREVVQGKIKAIGITNQRETTVVWDRKTGKPVMHAIVWQDRRTTSQCRELKQHEEMIRKKTGLLLDPYFSATKLAWILKTVPGALERAKRGELAFGTIDTWLLWKLTGGKCHATDVTNASRTLLFNIHTLTWDDDLLTLFGIPREILPTVHASSFPFGETNHPLFSEPTPIRGIAGDQQAALVGQACFSPGMVKSTYGTGCFMLMNTGEVPVLSKHNLLTTVAYQVGNHVAYALEGSVFIGGAVVQWLRDNLKIIREAADVEMLANSVPDSDGVYFVPAFTGLGAPYWDPYARGAIVGLSRGTTGAHIARAALDSIAHQVTDVLQAMEGDAKNRIAEIRVDGGAVNNPILMQLQADLMGVPVVRPQVTELTALGAAYLAGLSVGMWKDFAEVAKLWREERRFMAAMMEGDVKKRRAKWARVITCAQTWEI